MTVIADLGVSMSRGDRASYNRQFFMKKMCQLTRCGPGNEGTDLRYTTATIYSRHVYRGTGSCDCQPCVL